MRQSKKLEKLNKMSEHEIVLDMFEEYLSRKYNLYINYSNIYADYISYFAQEQYRIKTHHKPVKINNTLSRYMNLLNCLKKHPEVQCVLSYNRRKEQYKAALVTEEIKGLKDQDEYIETVEQYAISDESLFNLLNTLEIYMGEYLEEERIKKNTKTKI